MEFEHIKSRVPINQSLYLRLVTLCRFNPYHTSLIPLEATERTVEREFAVPDSASLW